ncbi:MAG: polyprenyl synthetase family protein [Nitrososphaerota archaeon]
MYAEKQIEFQQYINKLRRDFELYLISKFKNSKDSEILKGVLSGGKRLRPILLLLVFNALDGKDFEKALEVALALELAHSASLVHDDIIDMDLERRGKPTLWRQIGIGRALIQGHRVINLAFKIALKQGIDIAKIFLTTWERASNGALEELKNRELPGKTMYLNIIREKTASLFEAAAECGAILANAPEEIIIRLKKYGENVGIAYQLADDYVDLLKGSISMSSHLLIFNRFEEKIRQIMLSIILRRFPPFRRLLYPRLDWLEFLFEEIKKNLREAVRIVDSLSIPEIHKIYLKKFPLYCVRSMFSELLTKK